MLHVLFGRLNKQEESVQTHKGLKSTRCLCCAPSATAAEEQHRDRPTTSRARADGPQLVVGQVRVMDLEIPKGFMFYSSRSFVVSVSVYIL